MTFSDLITLSSTVVTAIATVALSWFGYVQIKEGKRDRESRRLAAIDTLAVEMHRLLRLSQRWLAIDPVALARKSQLPIDDLLPPDWGLVTSMLGQIGGVAALLGAVAYGKLNDAVVLARDLKFAASQPRFMQAASGEDQRFAELSQHLSAMAAAIQQNLMDAADGLADAVGSARPKQRPLELPGDLTSNVAEIVRVATGLKGRARIS